MDEEENDERNLVEEKGSEPISRVTGIIVTQWPPPAPTSFHVYYCLCVEAPMTEGGGGERLWSLLARCNRARNRDVWWLLWSKTKSLSLKSCASSNPPHTPHLSLTESKKSKEGQQCAFQRYHPRDQPGGIHQLITHNPVE